jgi:hypothetical protein
MNPDLPNNTRLKAAEIAAKYCHPTLQAIVVGHADGDFADRLERATQAARLAQTGASPTKVIEATKVSREPVERQHPADELTRNGTGMRRR